MKTLFHLITLLAVAPALTLAQPLPVGVEKRASVEGITEYALSNGLRVLLLPDLSQPKVTVNITYLVGSRHQGAGERGMAHMLEHVLTRETKTGRDIKAEQSKHGAVWNATTESDCTSYYETLTANEENLQW